MSRQMLVVDDEGRTTDYSQPATSMEEAAERVSRATTLVEDRRSILGLAEGTVKRRQQELGEAIALQVKCKCELVRLVTEQCAGRPLIEVLAELEGASQ
jgi:hypothetical protein